MFKFPRYLALTDSHYHVQVQVHLFTLNQLHTTTIRKKEEVKTELTIH